MESKLTTNYYAKYVGAFAKRFYTPYEKENIFEIIDFFISRKYFAYFKVKDENGNEWDWDVEDCVIITNETPIIEDERVANITDPEYSGYNPYNK
jgi:hypothetical protein